MYNLIFIFCLVIAHDLDDSKSFALVRNISGSICFFGIPVSKYNQKGLNTISYNFKYSRMKEPKKIKLIIDNNIINEARISWVDKKEESRYL